MKKTFILLIAGFVAAMLTGCASASATAEKVTEPATPVVEPQKDYDFVFEVLNACWEEVQVTPLLVTNEGEKFKRYETRSVKSGELTVFHFNTKEISKDFESWQSTQSKKYSTDQIFFTCEMIQLDSKTKDWLNGWNIDTLENQYADVFVFQKLNKSYVSDPIQLLYETTETTDFTYTFNNNTDSPVYVANIIQNQNVVIAVSEYKLVPPYLKCTYSYNRKILQQKYPGSWIGITYNDNHCNYGSKGWMTDYNSLTEDMVYNLNSLSDTSKNHKELLGKPLVTHDGIEATVITADQKKEIKKALFEQYSGKANLSKKEFDSVNTIGDLVNFLKTNIKDDNHFWFLVQCSCGYIHIYLHHLTGQVFDKNSFKSADTGNYVREYRSTSNAEYVRISDESKDDQTEVLRKVKGNKQFIIFDYRSNSGGTNLPQLELLDKLKSQNYKGQLIILQDNYCYSGGEVAMVIPDYPSFNWLVMGQHSGGMNMNGNWKEVKVDNMIFGVPSVYRSKEILGERWEGEGIGYRPDIFIERIEDFVPALEQLGVDMIGIVIK